jgi:hypothetical protein
MHLGEHIEAGALLRGQKPLVLVVALIELWVIYLKDMA